MDHVDAVLDIINTFKVSKFLTKGEFGSLLLPATLVAPTAPEEWTPDAVVCGPNMGRHIGVGIGRAVSVGPLACAVVKGTTAANGTILVVETIIVIIIFLIFIVVNVVTISNNIVGGRCRHRMVPCTTLFLTR